MPNITVVTKVNQKAITRFFFISSSHNPKIRQQHVDKLDSEERRDDSTHSVDEQVALQERCRSQRTIAHAAQRQRYQGNKQIAKKKRANHQQCNITCSHSL